MNELTLFESGVVNVYRKESEQLVDARELHEGLDVKTPFHKWVSRRIEKYGFQENVDYITMDKIVRSATGAKTQTDYILKLDMAKELAMVEPNEKGKEVRRYFIKAEKQFKKWLQQRANGKATRQNVTDAVRDYIPESPNKKFKYKNFTDLIYKLAFDKNAKQLREEKGLDKKINIREHLSIEELKEVERIENEIGVLIGVGLDYKAVKEMLGNKYKTDNPKGLPAQ